MEASQRDREAGEVNMEWNTDVITATSTGTLALIGVASVIYQVVSRTLRARAAKRYEISPLHRVEIVNLRRYNGSDVMVILIRNRSHVPVRLDEPVFEIRGIHRTLPGGSIRPFYLEPGEMGECLMKFDGDVWDASPEECVLVDIGSAAGA